MADKNLLGQTILGYKVVEEIGRGASGTVYRVIKNNASGNYERALKHISIPNERQYSAVRNSMGGNYAKTDDYFSKLLNEIVTEVRILNSLSEKGVNNIVRYYENNIDETISPKRFDVYILMEYLTPFNKYIETNELKVSDVINIGLSLLSALKACHDNGIIHRDVKDDNIFVSNDKIFKLGDFSVSKVLKDKSKAESMKGTPNYIAPEVHIGNEKYTNSVDLYSLGIVLYRLLNYSRNPFMPSYSDAYDTDDEDKAFLERMKGNTPPLPQIGGDMLGKVIVKAILGKDARYQTADEFYSALLNVKNKLPSDVLQQIVNTSRNNAYTSKITSSIKTNNDGTVVLPKDLYTTIPVDFQLLNPLSKRIYFTIINIIPVIIALSIAIICGQILPNSYGKSVSFYNWLFTSPNSIIKTVQELEKVVLKTQNIVIIRIGIYGLIAAFITSLFFFFRRIIRRYR